MAHWPIRGQPMSLIHQTINRVLFQTDKSIVKQRVNCKFVDFNHPVALLRFDIYPIKFCEYLQIIFIDKEWNHWATFFAADSICLCSSSFVSQQGPRIYLE